MSITSILKSCQEPPAGSRKRLSKKDAISTHKHDRLIAHLDLTHPRGILLRAVLSIGLASGGRLRSKLNAIQFQHLGRHPQDETPVYYYAITLD